VTLTTKVLLGLGLGLAAGAAVSASGSAALATAVTWIEPVGTIWINALRMTIVPLVVAGLVVGAASSGDARSIGRLGGRALAIFLALLAGAAAFTVIVAPPLFALLPLDPAAVAALRESAGGAAAAGTAAGTGFPDFRQWLVDLVPSNAFRSAADGAILPLIVFSLALGFAIAHIAPERRDLLVSFFRGLFDAMLTLIRWVLAFAPIGVFALALPLATRLGLAAAGAVLYFIAIVSGLCLLATLALYPIAATLGRAPLRRFARAAAPAQSIGFSARSSLAALPAMIETGREQLGFPPVITNFFLPLSASMFRYGSAIGISAGVLFLARLYGVELGAVQLVTIALTTVLLTFSVPGVPGGSILIMMPVLQAVGVPPEGVAILLGVDTIPDMFRTTANVSGTFTAATVLSAGEARESELAVPVHAEALSS
jgi:Na+/H+-dicarboxylate symporter